MLAKIKLARQHANGRLPCSAENFHGLPQQNICVFVVSLSEDKLVAKLACP